MKTETIISIIMVILVVAVTIIVFLVVLEDFNTLVVLEDFNTNLPKYITYIQCCGGNQCTDTYYTPQDNLCHLVLCESSMFTNKEDCVYEGANKTINLT